MSKANEVTFAKQNADGKWRYAMVCPNCGEGKEVALLKLEDVSMFGFWLIEFECNHCQTAVAALVRRVEE